MSQEVGKKASKPLKVLELFSGTESFSKVARARGHETFTIDYNPDFHPSLCKDVLELRLEDLPGEWRHPDIVWASPDCRYYSVMVINKNWENKPFHAPIPKRKEAEQSMRLVQKTLELIREMQPAYYFIENPRAMLRKMPFMQGWPRSTITYCKYGFPYQKATDIWNNCYAWKPKPPCSANSPCHVRVPRNSHNGLQSVARKGNQAVLHPMEVNEEYKHKGSQRDHLHPVDIKQEIGWNRAAERAVIPPALCAEIITACEGGCLKNERY